jgi:hypothetical protein
MTQSWLESIAARGMPLAKLSQRDQMWGMSARGPFFRDQAKRCRDLAAKAIKAEIRQGLLDMATDFERFADELDGPRPAENAPSHLA